MGEVVALQIQPKTLRGAKRNATWEITYIPAEKVWSWSVTVQLTPQVYSGTSPTQAAAQKEVAKYLS